MASMEILFLGVDGGGSGCRIRLVDQAGRELGAGVGGATNIRLGLEAAWASILGATDQALAKAGLDRDALPRIQAGLGLAGITGPVDVERVRAAAPGFAGIAVDTDAHAACLGAFAGQDGAIIIIGTAASAMPSFAASRIRSAAGASRSLTRAAAPISAARRCAQHSSAMTGSGP